VSSPLGNQTPDSILHPGQLGPKLESKKGPLRCSSSITSRGRARTDDLIRSSEAIAGFATVATGLCGMVIEPAA
jgi:hypothetical protein